MLSKPFQKLLLKHWESCITQEKSLWGYKCIVNLHFPLSCNISSLLKNNAYCFLHNIMREQLISIAVLFHDWLKHLGKLLGLLWMFLGTYMKPDPRKFWPISSLLVFCSSSLLLSGFLLNDFMILPSKQLLLKKILQHACLWEACFPWQNPEAIL